MSTDPGFKEEQEVTLRACEATTSSPAHPSTEAVDSTLPNSIADASRTIAAGDGLGREMFNSAVSSNQTVFDDHDPPRLTPKQILSNIRKSLFAADSILGYLGLFLCAMLISIGVTYFQATAGARSAVKQDCAPLALSCGLITAATGEPDMAYALLVSATTGTEGLRGKEKSIELASKFITEHHLQHKRTLLGDSLGSTLGIESTDYAAKDKLIALLKDVIPNQSELHEALAWQHIRRCDFGSAIDEQKKALKILPLEKQYWHADRETTLRKLMLASGRWKEVVDFKFQAEGLPYFGGKELALDKVDALFHSNQLHAAGRMLSKLAPADYSTFNEEALWEGRILLQENKPGEARKKAESLLAKGQPREAKAAGKLLMSEILIAESSLASNAETRQRLLDKAKAFLNDREENGAYEEPAQRALRLMQLNVLSGDYARALSLPDLEKFLQEDPTALRQRAIFHANRALCNLHLKTPAIAMQDVNDALKINPFLAKGLEVGILVCKKTNDTAKRQDFERRLSQVRNNPRLQTEI